MSDILTEMLEVAGPQPDQPKSQADRIQMAFYKVQQTKKVLKDPEQMKKLAFIASAFKKTKITLDTLSNQVAKETVGNLIDYVYHKLTAQSKGKNGN